MKRILSSLFACIMCSQLYAGSLQAGVDKLINQIDPSINIGVEVIDLTTGETLYARNANRSFVPASNMKIFSDAAALMLLGPDYHFYNQLSTNATQLQQGHLKGNLYLHLPGDPSFSHEDLEFLLATLKKWKVKVIEGNIIVNSGHAAVSPYPPGWLIEDLAYSYGAPLAPVIVDTNRLMVTVNPAEKAGKAAVVEAHDASGIITINNKVQTKANLKGCGVSFTMDKENELTVQGCVGLGQWAVQQKMAVRNPMAYLQGLTHKQLAKLGIKLEGSVQLGKSPGGTLLIASKPSKPIAQLMADTLKPSDNLYAESLFLYAAAKLKGTAVNWNEAQPLVKNFLQKQTGINLQSAVLADGSGLSRHDLLTPSQTVNLLRFLHDRFPFSYEFIAALPVSGRDGTLQRRFHNPGQQDFVRAKTGTMRGIISLSGYLYTMNGHTLAFAIYINNLPGTKLSVSGRYRYLVDSICTFLLQQNPTTSRWAKIFSPHGRMDFQQNTTYAQLQRNKQAKWRRLETVIKQSLKGQPVTVILRKNELILKDYQNSPNNVWTALQALQRKYPFAIALIAQNQPPLAAGKPLLWIETGTIKTGEQRVWKIREAL